MQAGHALPVIDRRGLAAEPPSWPPKGACIKNQTWSQLARLTGPAQSPPCLQRSGLEEGH